MFGKYAAERRHRLGKGRPETFDFLGFTHYCATSRDGKFIVKRKTQRKRKIRKLKELRIEERAQLILGQPKSAYARGRELKPGLWNNIHATVDYGHSEGFVEGSDFMPEGYPFTAALKVLCEGGVVDSCSVPAASVSRWAAPTLSSSTNPAKPTPWTLSRATPTRIRHPIR